MTSPTKPPLTIDLMTLEGNVLSMIDKAQHVLVAAGQPAQATDLNRRFTEMKTSLPQSRQDTSYEEIKNLISEYCEVTWLNEGKERDQA